MARETAERIIEVKGLTVGYGGETVLEGVDFSVRRGEIVTLLGPSGCGKSTLLKVLAGLLTPTRGEVRISGRRLHAGRSRQGMAWIHQNVGVLFQSGALLSVLSIAENVALPLRAFTDIPGPLVDRMVELKLALVQMGGQGGVMPSALSGGMRKRASLARALAMDPLILLCDEPSSGLDPATAMEIDRLLLELNSALGVTLLIVTHELSTIDSVSERSLMLHQDVKGILAAGTPADLRRSDDPRIREYFHREATA